MFLSQVSMAHAVRVRSGHGPSVRPSPSLNPHLGASGGGGRWATQRMGSYAWSSFQTARPHCVFPWPWLGPRSGPRSGEKQGLRVRK